MLEGARRMLAAALEDEVAACLAPTRPSGRCGRRLVVRAEDREHAAKAIQDFAAACKAKYPKAVAKITGGQEQSLAFFEFPAKHWVHLKTGNAIESTFATVQLATKVTKGPGGHADKLEMVFNLVEAVGERWRYVNDPHPGRPGPASCAGNVPGHDGHHSGAI